MIVSEERLTKALKYLAETDEPAARAKAYMIGIENQEKTILAVGFLAATGTVAERESNARTSAEFLQWQKTHEQAVYDFEIMRNKRNTETMIVEVWRSLNSNRRAGVV